MMMLNRLVLCLVYYRCLIFGLDIVFFRFYFKIKVDIRVIIVMMLVICLGLF